jgi:hypothetical protein
VGLRTRIRGPVRRALYALGVGRRLPDFLIIGAQKSGTSALSRYLADHPQCLGVGKELHFFSNSTKYRQGLAWYAASFPLRGVRGRLLFEKSPHYIYHPEAAARIRNARPDIKLLLVLRNPTARAYSAWQHYRRGFTQEKREALLRSLQKWPREQEAAEAVALIDARADFPPFRDAVEDEIASIERGERAYRPHLVRSGIYHEQIQRYLDHFPAEQLHIMESSALRRDPRGEMRRVTEFLGIAPPAPFARFDAVHEGGYEEPMDAEIRARLDAFYRPHNEKLFALLGRRFAWGTAPAVE